MCRIEMKKHLRLAHNISNTIIIHIKIIKTIHQENITIGFVKFNSCSQELPISRNKLSFRCMNEHSNIFKTYALNPILY